MNTALKIANKAGKIHFLPALIVLVFISLFISKTSAQTVWAPIGAKWVNEAVRIESGIYYLITFESIKDTMVSGKNCKKIHKTILCHDNYGSPCNTKKDSSIFFIYSDNDKVYYSTGDSFILMYDFSLNTGDTFRVYQQISPVCQWLDTSIANTYIIDSINYVEISGKILKRQYLHQIDLNTFTHCYYFYPEYIVERIGCIRSLFGTFGDPIDDLGPPYLKCYSDNDIFYQDTSFVNCNSFEDVSEANKPQEFKLYPNPAYSELKINYSGQKPFDMQIINSLGIIMKEQNNQFSETTLINLEALDRGIFFIILKTDNTRLVRRIVKN